MQIRLICLQDYLKKKSQTVGRILMAYFHLNSHIRCCAYQGEVILLDMRADRYIFLDENDSQIFLCILSGQFTKNNDGIYCSIDKLYDEKTINNAIVDLRNANILSPNDFRDKFPATIYQANDGMDNIDWNLTTKLSTKTNFKYNIVAYFFLIKIFLTMKLFGLNHLVQKIKSIRTNISKKAKDIDLLVAAINKACLYFPVRVKCLEWSFAFYFLARKYGIHCQFVVGLQNYPFKAHAWIEYENKVIADSPSLGKALAIIIREPS